MFNVINGPDVWFRGRLRDRSRIWRGRCVLEGSSWAAAGQPPKPAPAGAGPHRVTTVHVHPRRGARTFRWRHVYPGRGRGCPEDVFLFSLSSKGATVGVVSPPAFSVHAVLDESSGLSAPYAGHFSWADPNQANDVATLWPLLLVARSDARWSQALFRWNSVSPKPSPARSAEVSVMRGSSRSRAARDSGLLSIAIGDSRRPSGDRNPHVGQLASCRSASIPLAEPRLRLRR